MTNAIEQTKREMYDALRGINNFAKMNCHISIVKLLKDFNEPLEAHLEELRKALVAGNAVIVECAQHSAESFVELERRLAAMTEERDAIQLRLHAVDHAYSKSQTNVGLQLNLIGSLRKELRESYRFNAEEAGTSGQVCADHGASEQPDGKAMALLGAIVDCQQIVTDWAVYDLRAKKQMKKMAYVLNNNPELRAALIHFEGSDKS